MLWNNGFQLIVNDEKYFVLQDQSAPINRDLYTSDKRTTAPQVKFKRTQKFEAKILQYQKKEFRNKLLVKQLI